MRAIQLGLKFGSFESGLVSILRGLASIGRSSGAEPL
jgi:hypothetical protein